MPSFEETGAPFDETLDTPAKRLLGVTLENGWKVVERVKTLPCRTGGAFSIGYVVKNEDGRTAYLKALDFNGTIMNADDPAAALQIMTEAFNFERSLLQTCSQRKFSRVASAVDHGVHRVPGFLPVQYLIFELADGDIRQHHNFSSGLDWSFALRTLHYTIAGLNQLHSVRIAHQDVKPSNILVFNMNQAKTTKVADLGRAACQGQTPPHEEERYPGDPSYAPPELLYGFVHPEWIQRRFGCDAYLMGSLVVYFFAGASATALLKSKLDSSFLWGTWQGTYREVLPYLQEAFSRVLGLVKTSVDRQYPHIDPGIRELLIDTVRELCEPDIDQRGHPRTRAIQSNQYALDRYVARFDLLATQTSLNRFRRR